MKKARRTAVLLLTLVTMALALTATVSAKQLSLTDHNFKIYQIFKGTTTSKGVIEEVEWGSAMEDSSVHTALIEALQEPDSGCKEYFGDLTTSATAAQVASKLDRLVDEHGDAYAFSMVLYKVLDKKTSGEAYVANKTYDPGYYLIEDVTDLTNREGDAHNLPVLQLTDKPDGAALSVNPKIEVPELEKTVRNSQNGEGWSHSASYKKDDIVTYRLKCTLGDLLGYSKYKIVFEDFPSTVFEIDTNSTKVYINSESQILAKGTDYSLSYTESPERKFTVTLPDVIASGAKAHDIIYVEYNAKFVSGSGSHENTARVLYSSDPLNPDDTLNPTPPDKTNVHNFIVIVNKVDGENKPLTGAVFSLYAKNDQNGYDLVKKLGENEAISQFKWEGIKAGTYLLREESTPSTEYIAIKDVEFTIYATFSDEKNTDLTELWTDQGTLFKSDVANYTLTATVVNVTGPTLPETGGRGTRMFYIAGSILFLGGAILLVTKRRMYDPE